MYKSFYADNALTAWPLFALGMFLLFFVVVVIWALVIKKPTDFDAMACLPFDDSPNPTVHP